MSFDDKNTDCTATFDCKKCGDCCRGYGGTYVTDADIHRISKYTGIEKEKLISGFLVFSGGKPVLAQKPDGYCIFWDQFCRIHPVKPRMCRDWPFIRALLTHPENWRIMAGSCPGINPDADPALINRCVKQQISESTGKDDRLK